MNHNSKIFIAGENTMEGKVLIKLLLEKNHRKIVNLEKPEPDLTNHMMLKKYFDETRPNYVFLFAGKTGGIKANQDMPATLMIDNLYTISNVISIAKEYQVNKLLYLASSCIYPKYSEQPMLPDMLMQGPMEPTNSAYAMAKLAGIELCQSYRKEHGINYISAIPANIFGPEDDFSEINSHVVAALIRKMNDAKDNGLKKIKLWGTGKPRREFIYVYDLADACFFLMKNYNDDLPINIGTEINFSISELAEKIKSVVGFDGTIDFDFGKPDGMPKKILDSKKLFNLGWRPSVKIESGLEETYKWFKSSFLTECSNK